MIASYIIKQYELAFRDDARTCQEFLSLTA
jgi:hypothetical protein